MNKKLLNLIIFSAGSAAIGFILMKSFGAIAGAIVGLFVPAYLVKYHEDARQDKFSNQLIDAVLLISSCLRAGLSFNQAIEVLCQEMPDPIAGEFAIVLKSIRIGVPLDDAFADLTKRMPVEELKFLISAILVARETGGDLPSVLIKLVDTLRDRYKLKENIKTYTIQGKVQGFIMGAIPVVFYFVVKAQNPHHFDIMLSSATGKFLLALCVLFQVLAIVFIIKVSKVEI
jgi:tight adherence protein B